MKNRLKQLLKNIASFILVIIGILLFMFIGTIYVFYLGVILPLDVILIPLIIIIWVITGKWFMFYFTQLPIKLLNKLLTK